MVLKNSLLVAISIFSYFYFFQNKLNHESVIDSVVLLSDFQNELGCKSDFSPDCEITRFKKSDGLWKLSILVPAGDRQIKVVHNNRFYGQKGKLDGAAIHLILSNPATLLFTYDANTHLLSFSPSALETRSFPPSAISITLDDTLIYDPNTNMIANPEDSIRYEILLKNQSGSSMTGVTISRTSDPNTTIDSFFLKASPLAFNDTFPYDAHPKMVMAGLGLLANDYDLNDPLPNPPFNANLTVVRVNSMPLGGAIPTLGGGSVTVMPDGSFSYDSTNTNGATTDFFQYTVLDQDGFYDSAFVLIQFNEPPAIASNIPATDTICAFEQRDTFLMTTAFSISDEGTVIASAKVEICTNYLASEDTLIPGSLPGGITTAWTDGSGTLMLMGNASLADYETAIEGIQYLNQAAAPNTSIREICITVNDGISNSNQVTRELKVKPINDCPTAVRDTFYVQEDDGMGNYQFPLSNVLDNDTDPENNPLTASGLANFPINGGMVSLGGNGYFAFFRTTGFSGLDSLSEGEMFFTRVHYTITDLTCIDSDSVIIKVTGVNDAPEISSNLSATDSICAFEMQDTFLVTTAFTLLDDEDNTDSATISICTNYLNSEDTLIISALPGGIMAAWNDATGTLKLYGSTTKANYATAIKAIQYLNSSNTPNINTRRICITVHDGDLLSNQVTREMKVKPVNDCPSAVRDTVSILENNDITMFNVLSNDTDLENNTLSVTKINGGMTLSMVNITGGTINNLATNGILNFSHTIGFSGLDSLTAGEMFFTRFEYSISDGSCEDSDSVIIKITGVNDAPLIASNLSATDTICAFEMQDTFLVTAAFTLLDDEENTDSATISICNNYLSTEDTLITGALPGGIMATWNDVAGTLKLYGSTTKANYATAIKALQYLNSSNTPNTNTRRICITVHDGDLLSNQVTRELKVKPVNDCPVAVRDTLSIDENAVSFTGNNNVLVNDTDIEMNPLSVSPTINTMIHGNTVMVNSSGVVTFTHSTGSTGLDTLNVGQMAFVRFLYTITDGGCTDSDSALIKVTGINDEPIADSNKYSLAQTSILTVATPGILADDDDIDNGSSITVGEVNGSAANVSALITLPSTADLTVNANGSFTYNPKCLVAGLDSFTYAAKDEHNALSNTVKVYLQISQTMWFVDDVVTNGAGSFSSPFNTFTSVEAQSQPGDYIFLFPGTYTQNLLLKNGQKLIGADEDWICPSGSIIRTATNVTTFQGELTLAMNDTIKGIVFSILGPSPLSALESRSSSGSIYIKDNNASVGNLTMSNNQLLISSFARCGLVIKNGGTLDITFDVFASSGNSQTALDLNNCNGMIVLTAGGLSSTGDTLINIKGGQVSTTFNNAMGQSSNFPLLSVTDHSVGTLTFQTGTLSVSNGTGLQFNNADGVYNFLGSATLSGGDAGIDIINGSAGNFTFTNTTITNPTGKAVNINGGNGSIGLSGGSISKNNAGLLIDIQSRTGSTVTINNNLLATSTSSGILVNGNTGGTITFAGTTKILNTAANAPVNLTSNTGAIVNFTGGGLDIDCTSATGFNATGGGTISVQGTSNSILSTTGTALNVNATIIGSSNLNFQSISSNGATKGITLNTTGSSGGLVVTGIGTTNGSGGIIQNINTRGLELISTNNLSLKNITLTNACTADFPAAPTGLSLGVNTGDNAVIHLQNVSSATFDNVDISGSAEQGINGHNVNGFNLLNSTISSAGNGPDEDGIHFFNMSGTCNITNTQIASSGDDNLNIQNNTSVSSISTVGTINISGGSYNSAVGGSGLLFGIRGIFNTTLNISGVTVDNNFSGGIVADSYETATSDVEISSCTIINNNDAIQISSFNGNTVYDIHDNANISLQDFVNIFVLKSAFASLGTLSGHIRNNIVTTENGHTADGIFVWANGGGTTKTAITNNTINYAGTQRAINIQGAQDGAATFEATITGNVIDVQLDGINNASNAISAQSQVADPSGAGSALCIDIGGAGSLSNTITHSLGGTLAGGDIRVRQRFAANVRLPGYVGGATDVTAVQVYLDGRNAEVSPSTATFLDGTFSGGGACQQP